MLISLISGKSLVAASLLITGGLGTVAMVHADSHARIVATEASVSTTPSSSTTQSQSTTTSQSTSSTTATTNINQGLMSGASVHGLCVAYKAHMMANGGATSSTTSHLANSKAFLELAELATTKGDTVTAFCASQGGVSMTAIPSSRANVTARNSVKTHNPIVASNNASANITLKIRP